MSEVYIHYSSLEDSIKKSEKARGEISGYIEELKTRIINPVSSLSGSDSSGYASTAADLAWRKINSLSSKASEFSSYEYSVRNFISTAKNKDKYVSSQIETIASTYVEKRTWYEKIGDGIYDFFCVDVSNQWDWTRGFVDCSKWVGNEVGNGLEKVKDWFKYGDGKYILNITMSVVGVVAAVAGTIAAIVAIPFTGGTSALTLPVLIGCIGAAATGIGAVITIVNSKSTIEGNAKALSLSGPLLAFDEDDGNPGAARYYGNISKLSDEWSKTDMGDASTNTNYAVAGKVVDTTKVVADTTAFVCNIASLGNVKDYRYKNPNDHVTSYSFTWSNIKKNIRADIGFNVSKSGIKDGKHPFNVTDGFFATKYINKFKINDSLVVPESVFKAFKGAKIIKNVKDTYDNISTLDSAFKDSNLGFTDFESFSDTFQAATGLTQFSKITSGADSYLGKLLKNSESLYKDGEKWYQLFAEPAVAAGGYR